MYDNEMIFTRKQIGCGFIYDVLFIPDSSVIIRVSRLMTHHAEFRQLRSEITMKPETLPQGIRNIALILAVNNLTKD